MQLSDWLQRIGQIHPREIELGLQRIAAVVSRMQLNRFSCPVITIAGTNGKGSTVGFLEHLYCRAGYRVGSYTSPHLLRFNERIKLKAKPVDDDLLCDAFTEIEAQRGTTSLTYFEYTTLAALYIFQQSQLDVIILEVGLGGRLDAVNIIDPSVAVITAIDLDHQRILGNDREAIGREKAGIFRSHGLAVCGDLDPPQSILTHASELKVQLSCVGEAFQYRVNNSGWEWQNYQRHLNLPFARLPIQNIATSLQVIDLLQTLLPVKENLIPPAVAEAHVAGRLQKLPGHSQRWVDVAHNPQSTRYLADWLRQQSVTGRVFSVWSMLADKDLQASLAPLVELVDRWFIGPLDVERAATAKQLQAAAEITGLANYSIENSVEQAYQRAIEQQESGDWLIVFGSFHTVAKVLGSAL